MTGDREAIVAHARTVLWLVDPDTQVELPPDVSIVVGLFAQTICDHRAELANQLAAMVRDTAGHEPLVLAEAVLRHIDIPEDSCGGVVLSDAFEALRLGSIDPRFARGCAENALILAAQAICVWAGEPEPTGWTTPGTSRLLGHPRCVNNPTKLLSKAKQYLASKSEVAHA